jgi:hypothetical protein
MAIYFAWDSGARPFSSTAPAIRTSTSCARLTLRAKSATGKMWLHLIRAQAHARQRGRSVRDCL